MLKIRFHGRGGQGAVTAAEVLALAAFLEGKEVQSFPQFGVERRGAPVAAFCRIDDEPITDHSNVYQPDCVIVLDISLVKTVKVTAGLEKDGLLILNTDQPPENYRHLGSNRIATVDATSIALSKKLGSEKAPIVNTTILGAVAKVTGAVKLVSVLEAISKKIDKKVKDNLCACEEAYEQIQIKIFEEGGENCG